MAKNILHTIEKNMSSFSKGQKLIANYILNNYDKAAFMTAAELGEACGAEPVQTIGTKFVLYRKKKD